MKPDAMASIDLLTLFDRGGPIMYIILLTSLYGGALVVERFLTFRRNGEELAAALNLVDTNPEGLSARSLPGRLHAQVMRPDVTGRETIVEQARSAFMTESAFLEKHLGALAVIATILPMIGLLGTVAGMIEAFDAIAIHGTGDPKILAGGISKALLTTAAGLITSIPLLYFHQLLNDRSDRLIRASDEFLTHLLHIRFGQE